ncbi:hypothetical protein D1BOALGB6SA_2026 [Olavius sp. associated proteobacterium Delta 1]|nr:hypothetical protein D1BOALGB6SA_2026 [Olavius sp. associated proteobacterium Delta 1]
MNIISNIDPKNILGYGVIGLGFLLAFMAYNLLRKEQSKEQPSRNILRSIYFFMGFSLLVISIGVLSEFIKSNTMRHSKISNKAPQTNKIERPFSKVDVFFASKVKNNVPIDDKSSISLANDKNLCVAWRFHDLIIGTHLLKVEILDSSKNLVLKDSNKFTNNSNRVYRSYCPSLQEHDKIFKPGIYEVKMTIGDNSKSKKVQITK